MNTVTTSGYPARPRIQTGKPSNLSFIFFCIFLLSYFLHFAIRFPVLGALRLDLVLALGTVLAIAAGSKKAVPKGKASNDVTRALVFLLVYIVVTLPFVEYPGSVLRHGLEEFLKSVCFYFFVVTTVDTPKKLRILLRLYVGCQVFRVLEPVYLHLVDGYWGSTASYEDWQVMDRLSGAPNDIINPNGLGFLVVTMLPLLHYLVPTTTKLGKIVWVGIAWTMLYALILSASRSSFLAFIFLGLLVIWRSRHRAALLAAAVVVGLLAVSVMNDIQKERYLSIVSHKAKGAGTAEGRINGLYLDVYVLMQRPVFGFGLGTSAEANSNFGGTGMPSHNLYLEVGQELGLVGLGIFISWIVKLIRSCQRAREVAPLVSDSDSAFITTLGESLLIQILVNLFFSFASYGLCEPYWYMIGGICVAMTRLPLQSSDQSAGPSPARRTTSIRTQAADVRGVRGAPRSARAISHQ